MCVCVRQSVLLQTSEYALLLVRLESVCNDNSAADASLSAWESGHTAGLRYATEVNLAIRNIHARITQHSALTPADTHSGQKQHRAGERQRKLASTASTSSLASTLATQAPVTQQQRPSVRPLSLEPSATAASLSSPACTSAANGSGGEVQGSPAAADEPRRGSGHDARADAMELTVEEVAARRWREAEAGHQLYMDALTTQPAALAWEESPSGRGQQRRAEQPTAGLCGGGAGEPSGGGGRRSLTFHSSSAAEPPQQSQPPPAARQRRKGWVGAQGSAVARSASSTLSASSSSSSASLLSSLLHVISERIGDLQFVVQAVQAEERAGAAAQLQVTAQAQPAPPAQLAAAAASLAQPQQPPHPSALSVEGASSLSSTSSTSPSASPSPSPHLRAD